MKIKTLALYSLAVLPTFVLAAGGDGSGATFKNPLGNTSTIPLLLDKVLQLLIQIGIPVLVVFIVYAGFQFVTAQGNATKIEEAKKALFWAVIGGAVLIGAKAISLAIQATVSALTLK